MNGSGLLKVAVDVDGVLADFMHSFLKFVNKKYNLKITVEQWTSFEPDFVTFDIWKNVVDFSSNPDRVMNIRPIKNSCFINLFSAWNEVIIATRRAPICMNSTKEWLDLYYDYDELIFTFDKPKGLETLKNADVLIDDKVSNIKEFVESGGKVGLLFDSVWNRRRDELNTIHKYLEDKRVIRCMGWWDAYRRLCEFEWHMVESSGRIT